MKVMIVYPYVHFFDVMLNSYPRFISDENEIIIITAGLKNNNYQSETKKDITIVNINSINIKIPKLIENFPIHLNMKEIIEYYKPDIIHINNLPFYTTYQWSHLANKLNIKNIVHVHGVIAKRNNIITFFEKFFLFTIGKYIFKTSNIIICLNESDALDIQKYGCPSSKILIIQNGVNTELFSPKKTLKFWDVIWTGRFVREKNLPHLIKSLKKVIEKYPNLKVCLLGDGPMLNNINSLAHELKIKPNIHFFGRIDHNIIPSFLNKSKIYVLSSIKEGMPFSILEAMSCGKAVVATNISGINNLIENGVDGILVSPNNIDELSKSIISLIEDDSKIRFLGLNARNKILEKYSWESVVKHIEGVYAHIYS